MIIAPHTHFTTSHPTSRFLKHQLLKSEPHRSKTRRISCANKHQQPPCASPSLPLRCLSWPPPSSPDRPTLACLRTVLARLAVPSPSEHATRLLASLSALSSLQLRHLRSWHVTLLRPRAMLHAQLSHWLQPREQIAGLKGGEARHNENSMNGCYMQSITLESNI